ncbi:MAG: hypothetical protein IJ600_07265 [Lachnospiraceae bacterium]|nr:hypothetical protein [Lachnospiraceae bacterium]
MVYFAKQKKNEKEAGQILRETFSDMQIEYLQEEIMTRYEPEKRLSRGCIRKTKDHG